MPFRAARSISSLASGKALEAHRVRKMASQLYEVFALRYARFADPTQGTVLMFPDDHAAPMPLDFFIWVIRGGGRTIVLDTGFDEASAHRRGRTWLRSPIAALA